MRPYNGVQMSSHFYVFYINARGYSNVEFDLLYFRHYCLWPFVYRANCKISSTSPNFRPLCLYFHSPRSRPCCRRRGPPRWRGRRAGVWNPATSRLRTAACSSAPCPRSGFRQRIRRWPLRPVQRIMKKMNSESRGFESRLTDKIIPNFYWSPNQDLQRWY